MKKLFVLIVLLSLLIPSVVYARGRPPEPVCNEGLITLEKAKWVDKISGRWGGWRKPHLGKCHGLAPCREWKPPHKRWRHQHRRWIKPVPGYWIDPVCMDCGSVSEPIYSTWSDWTLFEGRWVRERSVTILDAQLLGVCAFYIERDTKYPIKPLFPMQLLENYDPPEGWLPFCMVMTEGGVSVERQPAICGWIADNQTCGGMVYDDGTEYGQWACDRYGYERRPIIVLKCLWARHLAGQRDQVSFDKCQALAP